VSVHLLGIYGNPRQAAAAVTALHAGGFAEVEAYSPTPEHALEDAVGGEASTVHRFVLIGGLLGCFVGFALPIYTVLEWPLITGGKALISIPPFVIIAFELTILCAALGGVLGFLVLVGMPRLRRTGLYDTRFTEDRYGVQVACARDRVGAAEAILTAHGAEGLQHEA
jgi:hypothetical protein